MALVTKGIWEERALLLSGKAEEGMKSTHFFLTWSAQPWNRCCCKCSHVAPTCGLLPAILFNMAPQEWHSFRSQEPLAQISAPPATAKWPWMVHIMAVGLNFFLCEMETPVSWALRLHEPMHIKCMVQRWAGWCVPEKLLLKLPSRGAGHGNTLFQKEALSWGWIPGRRIQESGS